MVDRLCLTRAFLLPHSMREGSILFIGIEGHREKEKQETREIQLVLW